MPLFTVIMDFSGGTYISQVNAASVGMACVKWAEELDISEVQGLGSRGKESLINQMKEEEPQPLNRTINVWCVDAILRRGFALINIIQTETGKPSEIQSTAAKRT